MNNNGWTLARRKHQAELIRNWKPWEHSTGPTSEQGKKVCKMNAEKHGLRGQKLKIISELLKQFSGERYD